MGGAAAARGAVELAAGAPVAGVEPGGASNCGPGRRRIAWRRRDDTVLDLRSQRPAPAHRVLHAVKLPLDGPPLTVCILRLSALGDTCHVVPVVRTLQRAWPRTKLTWIIGKAESRLMELIDGVEFITVDKRAGLAAASRSARTPARAALRRAAAHAAVAAREPALARSCRRPSDSDSTGRAPGSCSGSSPTRASRRAPASTFSTASSASLEALGIRERTLRWDVPLPPAALEYAQDLIPDARPHARHQPLLQSFAAQLASRGLRGGRRSRRAASRNARDPCGGPTAMEREMGAAIGRGGTGAAGQPDRARHAAADAGAAGARDRAADARTRDRRTWPPWWRHRSSAFMRPRIRRAAGPICPASGA